MRIALLAVVTLIVVPVLSSCTPAAGAEELRSEESRRTELSVSPQDVDALVAGNGEFAFDLYRQLSEVSDNVFFSPYAVSLSLATIEAGAGGQTAETILQTMRAGLSRDSLDAAFDALELGLGPYFGTQPQGQGNDESHVSLAMSIWAQKGYSYLSDYLDVLSSFYGEGLHVTDFAKAPEPSRVAINDWAAGATGGRATELLAAGAVDKQTRLALVSAATFSAAWTSQFDEKFTASGSFNVAGGLVFAHFMHATATLLYTVGAEYKAVQLPYVGDRFAMLIIMPLEGELETFQASLDWSKLQSVRNGLTSGTVEVSMPRFSVDNTLVLGDALSAMGMSGAFDSTTADFSGMDGSRQLHLGPVVHEASIQVSESGTAAGAVTSPAPAIAAGQSVVPIQLNQPFLFVIQDQDSGAVLFLGRVSHP